MNLRLTTLICAAAIALAACSQTAPNDATDASGIGASNLEPSSPAYFAEAIGDRVLFPVDQSTLTQEAMSILDAQAGWLTEYAEFNAVIEGHADEQGTREYNLALGARRANAVRDYLSSRGIAESRLSTVSYGKERPLEICSTELCWSQNRRGVTVVSAGLSG